MDLTARKYRFIEQFMKIVNPEKLKRLEEVLTAELENEDETVAYTVVGEPLTKAQYVQRIKDAEVQIERGEFLTQEELKREAASWRK